MQKPDLSLFPKTPGVYLFKDASGHLLYIGKAKRLRNRLASYFRPESSLMPKTRLMLSNAEHIDILHTETEKEALLLEATLIKKHRPRYNIVLRDDKEYLLFRFDISKPYPRLEVIRKNSIKSRIPKGKIYGPFSSGSAARETWKLIHKAFPLRRCRDRSFANRTRPCLYYHMGNCLGPCVLDVNVEQYQAITRQVDLLLTGRSVDLITEMKKNMYDASEAMEYEKAATIRDQLRCVDQTLQKQAVVFPNRENLDLIGIVQTAEGLALGVVFVREGLLLDGRNFFWPSLSLEDTPELLLTFLAQYYLIGKMPPPRRIVVPWLPKQPLIGNEDISTTVCLNPTSAHANNPDTILATDKETTVDITATPQIPDLFTISSNLSELSSSFLSLENALSEETNTTVVLSTSKNSNEDSLMLMAAENAREAAKAKVLPHMPEMLASSFKSTKPIHRVEIVDISHTSGKQTRAGMVVFEEEQPVKQDYRSYSLDDDLAAMGSDPGDDYAALTAWAKRRIASEETWPDLILIDGGKGQLAVVYKAFIDAGIKDQFILASIAKARNEEGYADRRAGNVSDRIFLPGRSNPLPITPGSPELLFLQRMRDTAHDYVIGRHRKARAAAALSGELTRLPGVGIATAKLLFDHFGSLAEMAKAGEKGLCKVPGIGKNKANMLAKRIAILVEEKKANTSS